MNRVIGHVDLDYFFAQVEEKESPSLKGKPVIVCVFSGRTEDSGVVSTANYVARDLGIRSGMPIRFAKKRLGEREAYFIPLKLEKYRSVSERVMGIIKERVDLLEVTGIDEAFFDVTRSSQSNYEKARVIAEGIKREIMSTESLTCSIGIGRNKVIAKLASDISKPNGLLVIPPDQEGKFLDSLPIEKLYGVGPKTAENLKKMNVNLIGDLRTKSFETLKESLGYKLAAYLLSVVRGTYNEPVIERKETNQQSRIITLKRDTINAKEIFSQLEGPIRDLHKKLTSANKIFRTISVILILSDLSIKTKAKTLEYPTNDLSILMARVKILLNDMIGSIDKEVRRVGVRVSDLISLKDQESLIQYM